MRYCIDIETNGLLDTLDTVHCIVLKDIDSNKVISCFGKDYSELKTVIENAELLIGHNIMAFDIPAMEKVLNLKYKGEVFDTLVATRLIWADIKERDFARAKKGFPTTMIGRHSLKAWGFRLGILKDEIETDWQEFTIEMLQYCKQDVEVTHALYKKIIDQKYSQQSLKLEHDIQSACIKMMNNGIGFDVKAAQELNSKLKQISNNLLIDLQKTFPPWKVETPFTPKVNNKARGYIKGVPTVKVKEIEFNPGSRDHICNRLKAIHNWKAKAFTADGKPKMDEEILSSLKYPEAKLLSQYFLVDKRLGMLAEGKQAWLKHETKNRIHGSINANGAVTGRATHSNPNIAQVPAPYAPYGPECRALFVAPKGKVLVGCDAASLELRMLAHYMSKYDNGKYADIVVNGDIHTHNQEMTGIETRTLTKTWTYTYLYGGGNAKLGHLLGKSAAEGKRIREKFLANVPAMASLQEDVQDRAERGYLFGLDKRKVPVRSTFSALNALLQSAGSILCKQWIVELEDMFDSETKLVGWIHDEIIIETTKEKVDDVSKRAVESIRTAGKRLQLRVETSGDARVGSNWAEIH
jgi:DNA polymerase I-like protein with 3'-5' exonuclease and polymerase domains